MAAGSFQSLIATPSVCLAILASGQNPDGTPYSPNGSVTPRVVTVGNPAAGADWSVAVPAGKIWALCAIAATFTASAAVATRTPAVALGDGTNFPAQYLAGATGSGGTTASGVTPYFWENGASENGFVSGSVNIQTAIGRFSLNSAWVIKTITQGIQAGDQWSAISLLVQESSVPVF
jgi:hypothetical protein